MKLTICTLFLLAAPIAHAGLEKYPSLIVADKDPSARAPANAIRVTYLGVNGFQFETDDHVLLVDPYFTRVGLWPAALNQPIDSSADRVSEGLKHLRRGAEAILVTHAHFDHLLDVPEIMQRTHARLFAGPTAVQLVKTFGISPDECKIVRPGSTRTIGPWMIRVLAAQHDRLFGKVPFARCTHFASNHFSGREERPGALAETEMPLKPPVKASDWCAGEPLAFVIEAAGKRIYVDSGGVPGGPPSAASRHVRHGEFVLGRIDLAILGVALPDSRARFAEVVRQLEPRYILPSHQDDMFAAFSRGFHFGKLTKFPWLVHEYDTKHLPGHLILLDYFQPWTLR
jgi:L-ascorbate metabolism protein UlaG (beta-lactamase superfamily)